MAELERFEGRLAASLERLADEVPTEVDARQLTAAIASANARPRWVSPLGARGLRLAPALRIAFVALAILGLSFGLVAIAQRLVSAPIDTNPHGRMTCAGSSLATATGPLVLECLSQLPDPRLAGALRMTLGQGATSGATLVRPGGVTLDASGASWTGNLQLTTAPGGMTTGDAVLVGEGAATGLVLRMHLLSSDGRGWGLLGWIEQAR